MSRHAEDSTIYFGNDEEDAQFPALERAKTLLKRFRNKSTNQRRERNGLVSVSHAEQELCGSSNAERKGMKYVEDWQETPWP